MNVWQRTSLAVVAAGALALAAAACGGGGSAAPSTVNPITFATPTPSAAPTAVPSHAPETAISHVVVIVQENRSFDNLFMGYPGADSASSGKLSTGQTIALAPVGFEGTQDLGHTHRTWIAQYAGGQMYFDLGQAQPQATLPYSYVPQAETAPYWRLASQYVLADRMFQPNTGPSYVAHQYIVAGQSDLAVENPLSSRYWGCDSPAGTTVPLLGPNGSEVPGPFPCFDYATLADKLDTAGLSWRNYAPGLDEIEAIWSPFDAIKHIRYGPDWTSDVISPETNVLSDIPAGRLANVTWIVPTVANSDHPASRSVAGPQWVSAIVNAIGRSPFWKSTAIFIVWDDWGGWYDHVIPPQLDGMGLGFRVPMLVVSPYAKRGYVSHVQHEFGSILKFAEERYGLAPLAASDARADDLWDCFDFTQKPRPFVPLATTRRPESFRHAPDTRPPDDD
jgi:phospholipase C